MARRVRKPDCRGSLAAVGAIVAQQEHAIRGARGESHGSWPILLQLFRDVFARYLRLPPRSRHAFLPANNPLFTLQMRRKRSAFGLRARHYLGQCLGLGACASALRSSSCSFNYRSLIQFFQTYGQLHTPPFAEAFIREFSTVLLTVLVRVAHVSPPSCDEGRWRI